VPWTPEKVFVVKAHPHVIPTAVAGVIVDHSIGCVKFIGWMSEAADQDYRSADRPSEPRQTARESHEEICVFDNSGREA
jgi:hypothetical protein